MAGMILDRMDSRDKKLDKYIQEGYKVVARQGEDIDELKRENKSLKRAVNTLYDTIGMEKPKYHARSSKRPLPAPPVEVLESESDDEKPKVPVKKEPEAAFTPKAGSILAQLAEAKTTTKELAESNKKNTELLTKVVENSDSMEARITASVTAANAAANEGFETRIMAFLQQVLPIQPAAQAPAQPAKRARNGKNTPPNP